MRPPTEPLELAVDASEAPRRVLRARLRIPAAPGPLTLLYPKWLQGEHGPTGPITDLVDLRLEAGGTRLAWRRDETDLYAIHCSLPDGASELLVTLAFVAPPPRVGGFTAGTSCSGRVAIVSWNQLVLYPEGFGAAAIPVSASLVLPEGWSAGTALPIQEASGRQVRFATVSLETLVDAPVLCGQFLRQVELGSAPEGEPRHFLHVAGDTLASIELPDATRLSLERLVAEAGALFGSRPYGAYHWLLALSDTLAHFGLEHHESSDNRRPERALVDADQRTTRLAGLLSHEYVHAWNGKHRRPAELVVADFQQSLRTKLLWIYEGLTQYLGDVLTARSGLWTEQQFRDALALGADWAVHQRGREWRSLEDTAVSAQLLFRARGDWECWRRGVDFYEEGLLLWLEVDTLLREHSGERHSLDDLCRAFFGGGPDGRPSVRPYALAELCEALGALVPQDWRGWLLQRVGATGGPPPLAGIERAGWRLVHRPEPSAYHKALESACRVLDLRAALGLALKNDGSIVDVVPGSPADRAGLAPATRIAAVDWRRASREVLLDALRSGASTLELLVESGELYSVHRLEGLEGLRYPHLERIEGTPDRLAAILRPRSA